MVESSGASHVEQEPGTELRNEPADDRERNSPKGNGQPARADARLAEPAPRRPIPFLPGARSLFGLTRADHVVLALLSAVALSLMIWHWARLSGWGMRPVEVRNLDPESLDYRIDVNTATWVEFVQLDGIGEALAERIIADREANGPFRSVEDLRRVKGIGPKTIARIRKYLTVGKPGAAKTD
jgi:competence protein ComEA